MRLVLNTNIVLSALLWRGTPYRLLQTIRHNNRIKLFTSAVLIVELADVLARPSPSRRLALIGQDPRQILAAYLNAADIVAPRETLPVVADDPDDDHVIAAAVAAEADVIVSGDRHLLTLLTHGRIRVLNAASALQAIEP